MCILAVDMLGRMTALVGLSWGKYFLTLYASELNPDFLGLEVGVRGLLTKTAFFITALWLFLHALSRDSDEIMWTYSIYPAVF